MRPHSTSRNMKYLCVSGFLTMKLTSPIWTWRRMRRSFRSPGRSSGGPCRSARARAASSRLAAETRPRGRAALTGPIPSGKDRPDLRPDPPRRLPQDGEKDRPASVGDLRLPEHARLQEPLRVLDANLGDHEALFALLADDGRHPGHRPAKQPRRVRVQLDGDRLSRRQEPGVALVDRHFRGDVPDVGDDAELGPPREELADSLLDPRGHDHAVDRRPDARAGEAVRLERDARVQLVALRLRPEHRAGLAGLAVA